MSNTIKAAIYTILGIIICAISIIEGFLMYLSGGFLPVYVGKDYIMDNQIKRWILYVILIVVFIFSAKLAGYGIKYLNKRFHKILRRR